MYKGERGKIETLLSSNIDFVYYYGDCCFYQEQTVIAAMSTEFTDFLKECSSTFETAGGLTKLLM